MPSVMPTVQPSREPTSAQPSSQPSSQPSAFPSLSYTGTVNLLDTAPNVSGVILQSSSRNSIIITVHVLTVTASRVYCTAFAKINGSIPVIPTSSNEIMAKGGSAAGSSGSSVDVTLIVGNKL